MSLKDAPIRQKLMAGILLVSVVVMLLMQVAFFTYNYLAMRQTTEWRVATMAQIAASNATAALAFENRPDAEEILASLKAEQRIIAAAIYDQHNELFARYPADFPIARLPAAPGEDGRRFIDSHLIVFHPMVEHDRRLGTLYLDFDTGVIMRERLKSNLRVALAVMALVFFVAYLLSRAMQRQISGPILALADTVRDISVRQDFSLRARKHGGDEIGQLTDGFNEMLADIQAREKALQAGEARYRGTLDRMLEGCQIISRDWRIVYINDTAASHGRRVKEELLGRTMMESYPGIDGTAMFDVLRRCMQDRSDAHIENEFTYPDGSTSWFELSIQPALEGIFILSLDITARKHIEKTLLDANDDLEHKVAERTAELRVAKEQAESSDRLKSEFLATMSHELRTPLNAIIGFTGTLLMKLPGSLNAEQEKQLSTVQHSARHLLSLINDLLDVAKIESGKLELNVESITCQQVMEEVAGALRPAAVAKGLQFNVSMPAPEVAVRADRRALSQILINLTNNAIKFTEHGSIMLELREADARTGMVRISVADTGIGIDAVDQMKLFQSFAQLDGGSKRRVEGTGLGLYLSRKLAELLGGEISVRSERGKGSRFLLTLPATAGE
ncbi:MAG: ATP-binding protein [Rudaea sp.]|nr:ATP-binding protein [Rudaea sp.]